MQARLAQTAIDAPVLGQSANREIGVPGGGPAEAETSCLAARAAVSLGGMATSRHWPGGQGSTMGVRHETIACWLRLGLDFAPARWPRFVFFVNDRCEP